MRSKQWIIVRAGGLGTAAGVRCGSERRQTRANKREIPSRAAASWAALCSSFLHHVLYSDTDNGGGTPAARPAPFPVHSPVHQHRPQRHQHPAHPHQEAQARPPVHSQLQRGPGGRRFRCPPRGHRHRRHPPAPADHLAINHTQPRLLGVVPAPNLHRPNPHPRKSRRRSTGPLRELLVCCHRPCSQEAETGPP